MSEEIKNDLDNEIPDMECDDDGDENEHDFVAFPIAHAEFVKGNAHCRRTTRILLFCQGCGKTIWVNDPDQPLLEPSA